MAQEDHEIIKWYRDYQNGDSQEETEQALRRRFVNMDDQSRTKELQNFSSWLRDDSPLRVKASLVKLGRELNHLHQAMRKVGR
jgi:hypothetical protein